MTDEIAASLVDRVVIVTGASRGLGREMALELAAAGCRLALLGSRESAALDATGADAGALAGAEKVMTLAVDVSDADAAQRAVDQIIERFGEVDVLINNAGLGMRLISERFNTEPTKFWQASPEAWGAIIAANINGAFHMARAVAPFMTARGAGKIINISTSDQTMVRRGYSPYGPSKAALEAMSRVWAQDLAETGVTVNVYLPGGAADTDLLPPSPDKKGADGNLLPASVMRRGVRWLCSEASDGVTGQRFIARLWPQEAGAGRAEQTAAAEAARSASIDKPAIM